MARKSRPKTRNIPNARSGRNTLSTPSPDAPPRPAPAWGRSHFVFAIALVLVFVYLVLFFSVDFGPYASADASFPRAAFFTFLLLPEFYLTAWSPPGTVPTVSDKLPQCGLAALMLLAAYGPGGLLLRGLKIRRFDRLQSLLFAIMAGLGLYSTLFLALGLFGLCASRPLAIVLTAVGLLATAGLLIWEHLEKRQNLRRKPPSEQFSPEGTPFPARCVSVGTSPALPIPTFCFFLLSIPAVCTLLGSAAIPSNEYDVLSYHLQGAKEFYQSSRIGFVPHNVYMNMPFGAEMYALWGMALTGDWKLGGLVGKVLIASTTLLAGLGIFAFGRRVFDETTGGLAMLLYLQTPWINEVSGAGLIDGVVAAYLFFTVSVLLQSGRFSRPDSWGSYCLVGFFAGCAAACKYPAVPFVILPVLAWAMLRNPSRPTAPVLPLLLGVFYACALWYIKNMWTGNPVYPLLYDIFGDATGTWNAVVDDRWRQAHAPHGFGFVQIAGSLKQVLLTSPLLSPLIVPLAALLFIPCLEHLLTTPSPDSPHKVAFRTAFLRRFRRFHAHDRLLAALALYVALYFAGWWLLTHRIDRFWLPVLPLLSLLAAAGTTRACRVYRTGENAVRSDGIARVDKGVAPVGPLAIWWSRILLGLLVFSTVYTFLINAAPAPGKNVAYFTPVDSPHRLSPWAAYYNAHPPKGKLALIGEARAYDFDIPYDISGDGPRGFTRPRLLYATCWNDPPLAKRSDFFDGVERLSYGPGLGERDVTFDEMRQRLHFEGVSDILVHWGEIARFRGPGNYGFSTFPTPELFDRLVATGILEELDLKEEFGPAVRAYRVR